MRLKPLQSALFCFVMVVPASASEWRFSTATSQMDDSKAVSASVDSSESVPGRLGRSVHPELIVRCLEHKTEVLIDWKQFLTTGGIENETTVQSRIDSEKAMTLMWGISSNNEATFARGAVSVARRLAKAKRFIARTTPYGENPIEISFDLTGLEPLLPRIAAACGWSVVAAGKSPAPSKEQKSGSDDAAPTTTYVHQTGARAALYPTETMRSAIAALGFACEKLLRVESVEAKTGERLAQCKRRGKEEDIVELRWYLLATQDDWAANKFAIRDVTAEVDPQF